MIDGVKSIGVRINPNGGMVNKTFLVASIYVGLDLPIIDPMNKDMMDTVRDSKVLWNEDKGAEEYLASYDGQKQESKTTMEVQTSNEKDRKRQSYHTSTSKKAQSELSCY